MWAEITGLTEVRAARARLDERELELIDRARHGGATWGQVAEALGLSSRQAAEQRRQRLASARRARTRAADHTWSPRIVALRAAVADLHRWIAADRRWAGRFPRAELVRDTVTIALDAPAGALYALAAHLAADLVEVDPARLPAPVRAAATALRGHTVNATLT
ncbi:hypothetical protein [Micromonospora cathayae]|uniref:Homeodomain-like domain-containing protein n=1 Tax=Micromonospora cathayae TaxID=3028804 RepID=A0ABY7ZKG3_9ACTN|nr:hypothetical protein [Micromonospora sp. HUAS 3]WDZ83372.1 hypothetical protein PVK37_23325 [Micromonospora sp. HUAS 3]